MTVVRIFDNACVVVLICNRDQLIVDGDVCLSLGQRCSSIVPKPMPVRIQLHIYIAIDRDYISMHATVGIRKYIYVSMRTYTYT